MAYAQPSEAHVERLEVVGAEQSTAARRAAGARTYQAKVARALALMESMDSEEAILTSVRAMCVQALPGAMRNLVSMAIGTKKGCPASVQREAIVMVAAKAGESFEVQVGSGKLLAEMTLAELESHLKSMANHVADMQAIESRAVVVPDSGTTSDPIAPA